MLVSSVYKGSPRTRSRRIFMIVRSFVCYQTPSTKGRRGQCLAVCSGGTSVPDLVAASKVRRITIDSLVLELFLPDEAHDSLDCEVMMERKENKTE